MRPAATLLAVAFFFLYQVIDRAGENREATVTTPRLKAKHPIIENWAANEFVFSFYVWRYFFFFHVAEDFSR